MKTPEEIREEAKAFDESLPEDDNKSTSDFMELAYMAAYQSAQSSIEPEIEKRVEERMKDYKIWLKIAVQEAYIRQPLNEAAEAVNIAIDTFVHFIDNHKPENRTNQ